MKEGHNTYSKTLNPQSYDSGIKCDTEVSSNICYQEHEL